MREFVLRTITKCSYSIAFPFNENSIGNSCMGSIQRKFQDIIAPMQSVHHGAVGCSKVDSGNISRSWPEPASLLGILRVLDTPFGWHSFERAILIVHDNVVFTINIVFYWTDHKGRAPLVAHWWCFDWSGEAKFTRRMILGAVTSSIEYS